MQDRSNRVRLSSLAAALALLAGPVALADPADATRSRPAGANPDRVVLVMYQQGTPGGGNAGTSSPRVGVDAPSALPKAGANAISAGPGVGASRNPFHPHSVEMLRQSNRLKAQGYGDNVMNDGEIVLALNAAIKLLAKVDDESRGHPARAIREVEAAIQQIKTRAGKAGARSAAPPRAGTKAAPTRAESDAYLREAHKALEKIVFQINHGGNLRRLVPARTSIQKAIGELNAALEAR